LPTLAPSLPSWENGPQVASRDLNLPQVCAEAISPSAVLLVRMLMSFLNCKTVFPNFPHQPGSNGGLV
uniref:Uncharacterized protein n=1 Tax=Equus asinus asinus TaxID=83772 RepID=A0A8C4L1Z5_EQUAS